MKEFIMHATFILILKYFLWNILYMKCFANKKSVLIFNDEINKSTQPTNYLKS